MMAVIMNILFVDDDADVLMLYKQVLEDAFPKAYFIGASSGAQALNMCSGDEVKFSLILTDFKMPGMDGLEFIQALRHSESSSRFTPVILISGYTNEIEDSMLKTYAIHKLPKPISSSQLIEVCATFLGVRPVQKPA